jgi:hypothetical protein
MGTTIGNVLLSYDVDKSHTQVKMDMENLGYFDHFTNINDPKTYKLPNTTLWHPKKNSDEAMNDINRVCKSLQVTLERAVAVKATEFVGL